MSNGDIIIVEQFKGVFFVDVYVRRGTELEEIEQGVTLYEMHELINKFKHEYGITKAVFYQYDGLENQVDGREVNI